MSTIKIPKNPLESAYIIKSESVANSKYTLDEWIKFLSFVSPKEKRMLKKIEGTPIYDLFDSEIEEYRTVKSQLLMSELFIKYKNHDCTPDEHDRVFKYMDNSLEELMISRLSEEEREAASILLSGYRNYSVEDLEEYISDLQLRYKELPILDAYLLHEMRKVRYDKICKETNEKIIEEKKERERVLVKSLARDYGIRSF